MKSLILPRIRFTRPRVISFFSITILVFSLTIFSQINQAQEVQLSLADILIGLRSKKVTLVERNKILADAVKTRGITFSLTPEIQSELETGGADGGLIEAIRQKSVKIKVVAIPAPTPLATPIPIAAATPIPAPVATPTPAPTPDFAFYLKRADENNFKGEFDLAVNDYNKAIELNPKDNSAYLNRGRAFSNKKNFDSAIVDYSKAIELNPQESAAYFNRADSYEKKGNLPQAVADYQKAVDLDANNEAAKINLKRIQDAQQAKTLAETKKTEPSVVQETPKQSEQTNDAPKTVELGQLNDLAVKLAMPVYTDMAKIMKAQGKVTIQITLDEEGKVISAKATSGHSLLRASGEEAVRKSKFKPALVGNQAVRATGFITYNFVDNL